MGFERARRGIAERQVASGRQVIARQRELIAGKKARGLDTAASEQLLASFERSQAVLEEELAAIEKAGS